MSLWKDKLISIYPFKSSKLKEKRKKTIKLLNKRKESNEIKISKSHS